MTVAAGDATVKNITRAVELKSKPSQRAYCFTASLTNTICEHIFVTTIPSGSPINIEIVAR